MRALSTLLMCTLLTARATAQPVVNGSASDPLYVLPLSIQDTQTGFGDADIGRPDWANGSELDAAYGVVYDDTLYLVLAGNFETSGNKVEIFFDTISEQGQNQLLGAENPDIDYQALQRMGYLDPNCPGLMFEPTFEADYYITVSCYGDPTEVHVSYAKLYVDELDPGSAYYCGRGWTTCETNGGELTDGWPGAPQIRCTVDNRNVAGVLYGFGAQPDGGAGVLTGLELAIPLSAIGNPSNDFEITAFVNSPDHGYVSNQLLGGILGDPLWNLGEPRLIDLSHTLHVPFVVPISSVPVGACCNGDLCFVTTEADCVYGGGDYLGDNSSCDGNPCDTIPSGACCFDDGYSGECRILTASDCSSQGGTYLGDDVDCLGCPCLLPPEGACCVDGACLIMTEDDCNAVGGEYVGHFTACEEISCAIGACCIVHDCQVLCEFQCGYAGGRFLGEGTDCDGGPCDQTIWEPYVAGDMNGWSEFADPMLQVAPGIYEITFYLDPFTRYEFKITDGTWDNCLPAANSWCYTDAGGAITITYDANAYDDGWAPAWDRIGLSVDPNSWTAVGSWQGWDPNNPASIMQPLGGGIYRYQGSGLPAGVYYWKAVVTGGWDSISWDARSVHPADMQFGVADEAESFELYVNALNGTVMVELLADCNGNDLSDGLDLAQCDGSPWCSDCNSNGVLDACDIDPSDPDGNGLVSDDDNGNGIPDECEGCPNPGDSGKHCTADIFGDNCVVNIQDLSQLLAHYGTTGATPGQGDIFPAPYGDGVVNIQDLSELLSQYGDDCN
jgi:hypothetical protein